MISVTSTFLDEIPGESFLQKSLQSSIKFVLGQKVIKQGRLMLFRRSHYYLNITILTNKSNKESFEIPIPFKVEEYAHEGLAYFDYRLQGFSSFNNDLDERLSKLKIKNTSPSQYYNKILEVQAEIT
jgi:hypothetical protein